MHTRLRLIPALFLTGVFGVAAGADWDVANTGEPGTDAEFTVSEGTWMSVDVSPDGRTLVFDMLGDIYTLPAGGGEATVVAGGPAMQRQPRFSPDGRKILFLSDASGGDNLWIADANGASPRQITHETIDKLSNPAWAPDGAYVIAQKSYSRTRHLTEAPEVWMFYLDGGEGRVLVPSPPTKKAVHEAVFSPDGASVYYSEDVMLLTTGSLFRNPNQINFVIKRRDLASGEIKQILGGFGSATTPEISPDGKRIAFVRRVKAKTVLFVYDGRSGEQRPVFDDLDRDGQLGLARYGYYPQFSWFPDGRHIAIWGKGKLMKVDADQVSAVEIPFKARAHHRLTQAPRFENNLSPDTFTVRAIRQIAMAPDGKTVAFNALGQLWKKSLPDGKPQRLTQDSALEFEPAFSPDGQWLAYVGWEDERGGSLRVVSVKGGKSRTIVQSRAPVRTPMFSPDGRRLTYIVQKGTHMMGGFEATPGVYWVALEGGEAHFVIEEGREPQFSPDGARIYYGITLAAPTKEATYELKSVRLDGLEPRVHVRALDATDFRLSPDRRWLAFREHFKYFVVPYRETGAPMPVNSKMKDVPVAALTQQAGYDLTWSADSNTAHWLLGEELFSAPVRKQLGAPPIGQGRGVHIGLQATVDKPTGVVAFTNGRIITMQGDQVIEKGTLVATGNKITAIGEAGRVQVPAGAKVIDVAGKTLMPGMIDMHGHLGLFARGLSPQKHPSHYAALAFGITTDFDPATRDQPSFAIGEMNLAGRMVGPRFINAGDNVYGLEGNSLYVPIANLQDARDLIARKKALGAWVIKSYMQPMRSQRQQLIKAAREAGLMVTPEGELHFFNGLSMILDGHMSLEHNSPMATYYDDFVQLLAHSSTSVTPTLVVTSGELFGENYMYQTTRPWDDPKIKTYVQNTLSTYSPMGGAMAQPPYVRGMLSVHQAEEMWDIGFRSVARSLKKLDDAGVTVNAGGHGEMQGLDLHWELWLLAEGGWSNYRLLRTATINGAKTIGLDKQIGTLEVGKLADVIVLDANPLENIRNTNTVRYTMVNGRLYDSLSMNEIGNYNRPRGKFYWELPDYKGIEWNKAWSDDDPSMMTLSIESDDGL